MTANERDTLNRMIDAEIRKHTKPAKAVQTAKPTRDPRLLQVVTGAGMLFALVLILML